MRRIAIINQKGGVGKTTSCCNVGSAIAASGRSVLLIDLDPQAHLTMHLGIEPSADLPNIYDVLTDGLAIDDATVQVKNGLRLVPSHIDLAAAEMELVNVVGREVVLRDALEHVPQDYDFVLMDCPPSLGVLTINGLAAMEEVIVPMQPHFLALQGLGKLLETIKLVRDRINSDLRVTGIILCMYEAGTRLAGEVAADLAQFLEASRGSNLPWSDARIFDTLIRRNIKLAECPSHALTIAEYAPQSNGAKDYAALAAEIDVSTEKAVQQAPRGVDHESSGPVMNDVKTPTGTCDGDWRKEGSPALEPTDQSAPAEVAMHHLPSETTEPAIHQQLAQVGAVCEAEPSQPLLGRSRTGRTSIPIHYEEEAEGPAPSAEEETHRG